MKEIYCYKGVVDVSGVDFEIKMKKPAIDIATGYFSLDGGEKRFNKYISSLYVCLLINPLFEEDYDGEFRLVVTSHEFSLNEEETILEDEFDSSGGEFDLQFEPTEENQFVQEVSFTVDVYIEDDEDNEKPCLSKKFIISMDGSIEEIN